MQMAGVETCLKKSQRCNFYAECDPAEGSDTAQDELNCDDEYRKERLISKQATYRCQSLHDNLESVRNNKSLGVVWIRAVLNDGNLECWNGEDEIPRSTVWVSLYIPGLNQIETACLHCPAVLSPQSFVLRPLSLVLDPESTILNSQSDRFWLYT